MVDPAAALCVVIPTRDRWPVLARTLDTLTHQSVTGFEVVVVVDGEDQQVPRLAADHVIVHSRAGPGAARNRGVKASQRPLVLFLGDDIMATPRLVEHHLNGHARNQGREVAVLGHTEWHPEVASTQHNRWLAWSNSQFDFAGIPGTDAGWGRFYSSNVSLKRSLFDVAGGFDERFTFDYEDLDLAYRLHQAGMVLRYEKAALGHHLHLYDWPSLIGRYHSRGQGERMMADRHPWFEPWFRSRLTASQERPPVSSIWPRLARQVPGRPAALRRRIQDLGTVWYHQQLYGPFLGAWNGQDDLRELRAYLGDSFDEELLLAHRERVDDEERESPDEVAFYRSSQAYLYDLTMFAVWGTKEPYLAALQRLLPRGSTVLDYGCGIGSDGLRLAERGYQVSFADFDNPSTAYLKWRLERRGLAGEVFDVETSVPGGFDAVVSFDVIEHVEDPFAFLDGLEQRAELVMVNFLEPEPGDTHLHHALPVADLLNRVTRQDLAFYHRFERRSHLVAYRPRSRRRVPSRASLASRLAGSAEILAERLTRLPPPPTVQP